MIRLPSSGPLQARLGGRSVSPRMPECALRKHLATLGHQPLAVGRVDRTLMLPIGRWGALR